MHFFSELVKIGQHKPQINKKTKGLQPPSCHSSAEYPLCLLGASFPILFGKEAATQLPSVYYSEQPKPFYR
jgi:hypothetical protein